MKKTVLSIFIFVLWIMGCHQLTRLPGLTELTQLPDAARRGDFNKTRELLDNGADPNIMIRNSYALNAAAEQGYIDIVRILIDRGAKLNLIDSTDYTPLRIAAINGHIDVVRLLLEKGADPNIVLSKEKSDLPIGDNIEVARLLLDKGFQVNSRDRLDRTALMICASTDVVRLLLSRGADINAQDKNGWTALFYATMEYGVTKVRVLLENGADYTIAINKKIKIIDLNGKKVEFQGTPLELATIRGSRSIITLINKVERDKHGTEPSSVQDKLEGASLRQIQSDETPTSQLLAP